MDLGPLPTMAFANLAHRERGQAVKIAIWTYHNSRGKLRYRINEQRTEFQYVPIPSVSASECRGFETFEEAEAFAYSIGASAVKLVY